MNGTNDHLLLQRLQTRMEEVLQVPGPQRFWSSAGAHEIVALLYDALVLGWSMLNNLRVVGLQPPKRLPNTPQAKADPKQWCPSLKELHESLTHLLEKHKTVNDSGGMPLKKNLVAWALDHDLLLAQRRVLESITSLAFAYSQRSQRSSTANFSKTTGRARKVRDSVSLGEPLLALKRCAELQAAWAKLDTHFQVNSFDGDAPSTWGPTGEGAQDLYIAIRIPLELLLGLSLTYDPGSSTLRAEESTQASWRRLEGRFFAGMEGALKALPKSDDWTDPEQWRVYGAGSESLGQLGLKLALHA
jgi:hypothetical protein